MKKKIMISEAAEACGLPPDLIVRFISFAWITPEDPAHAELDEEDLARARLIAELQEFGVNDAGIPVILQLLDQLHRLHAEIRRS